MLRKQVTSRHEVILHVSAPVVVEPHESVLSLSAWYQGIFVKRVQIGTPTWWSWRFDGTRAAERLAQ